jgi:very-short-patch-repair endonuclease
LASVRLSDLSPRARATIAAATSQRGVKVTKRTKATDGQSDAEVIFLRQIRMAGLPPVVTQHRFAAPERKWRADFAFLAERIIIEVEGGGWVEGRHTRPLGFEDDCVRQNWAVNHGWRYLRVTPKMVEDGRALATIEAALAKGNL